MQRCSATEAMDRCLLQDGHPRTVPHLWEGPSAAFASEKQTMWLYTAAPLLQLPGYHLVSDDGAAKHYAGPTSALSVKYVKYTEESVQPSIPWPGIESITFNGGTFVPEADLLAAKAQIKELDLQGIAYRNGLREASSDLLRIKRQMEEGGHSFEYIIDRLYILQADLHKLLLQ